MANSRYHLAEGVDGEGSEVPQGSINEHLSATHHPPTPVLEYAQLMANEVPAKVMVPVPALQASPLRDAAEDFESEALKLEVHNQQSDSQLQAGSWFSWLLHREDRAQKAAREYADLLASCCSEDFTDLDKLQFLQLGGKDRQGRTVIVVVAKNYMARVSSLDRLYRYIISRCDSVTRDSYSLVWVHTQATYWHNCPSMAWLWQAYERLPSQYRTNLGAVYVLHCNLSLWLASMLMLPWFSSHLWRKVTWVSRVEFLWDYVVKRSAALPQFVLQHDEVLEDQPLADYGLVASKEITLAGLPGPL